MSNVKHPKCALRSLAAEAKARLNQNSYAEPGAPKNISPQQKEIYIKLCALKRSGEEIVNPIAQLADEELLKTLPHDQRQRYIIQLSADYVCVRGMMDNDNKPI